MTQVDIRDVDIPGEVIAKYLLNNPDILAQLESKTPNPIDVETVRARNEAKQTLDEANKSIDSDSVSDTLDRDAGKSWER